MVRSTVDRHLKELDEFGFLHIEKKNTQRGKPTIYKARTIPLKKIVLQPTYNIKKIIREFHVSNSSVYHKSTRELENISEQPQEYYVMYIEGDTNKTWDELHAKIYENRDGKRSEILPELLKNQPQIKRFRIKFSEPLYQNQSTEIHFEYKWDEPKKSRPFDTAYYKPNQLVFRIHFEDKKEHKAKLYEIDPLTNESDLSNVPPVYDKRNNTIEWNCEEAIKSRHYRVDWDEATERSS
ncbi:MAG: hypothetical protein KGI28_06465 [Thaumarchaeota archaeon]|nr:hypothetical protein [Nitrososphaerota archaeon]